MGTPGRAAALLLVAILLLPGAGEPDLAGEILRRTPAGAGPRVEVPIEALRALFPRAGAPEPPPVPYVVSGVEHRVALAPPGGRLRTAVSFRVFAAGGAEVRVLPASLSWRDVRVEGAASRLRVPPGGGWLVLDAPGPGEFRVAAAAEVPIPPAGARGEIEFRSVRGAPTTVRVDSDRALRVLVSGSPLPIEGSAGRGTHGETGTTVEGGAIRISWEPPPPAGDRTPVLACESLVAWNLADGADEIRARIDLAVSGGPIERVEMALPRGADRVAVRGADVREHRPSALGVEVFLKGKVQGRVPLELSYEVPRAAGSGRVVLPGFRVLGASERGGLLAASRTGEGIVLEVEEGGRVPVALFDLPKELRSLSPSAPVLAWRIPSGPVSGEADLVRMTEIPMRDTLIDAARVVTLVRPDGALLQKATYEMRNGVRQFMAVTIPAGAEILWARVSERPAALGRGEAPAGAGQTVLVPLAKSTQTVEGLVSFPVEIVWATKGPPLTPKGRLVIPIPRADVPVAYATAEVWLPEGFSPGDFEGILRPVERFGSETAEARLDYARAYADPAMLAAGADPARKKAIDRELAANYWRTGKDAYEGGDLAAAAESLARAIRLDPEGPVAVNARKLLGNVEAATGKRQARDRAGKAIAEQARLEIQAKNEGLLAIQKETLAAAERAAAEGNRGLAEEALEAAEAATKELSRRGAIGEAEGKGVILSILGRREAYGKERQEVQALRAKVEEIETLVQRQKRMDAGSSGAIGGGAAGAGDEGRASTQGERGEAPAGLARPERPGTGTGSDTGLLADVDPFTGLPPVSDGPFWPSGSAGAPSTRHTGTTFPASDLLGSYFGVIAPVPLQRGRGPLRGTRRDLSSVHDDFDYASGLRARWPVEYPRPPEAEWEKAARSLPGDAGFISQRRELHHDLGGRTEDVFDAALGRNLTRSGGDDFQLPEVPSVGKGSGAPIPFDYTLLDDSQVEAILRADKKRPAPAAKPSSQVQLGEKEILKEAAAGKYRAGGKPGLAVGSPSSPGKPAERLEEEKAKLQTELYTLREAEGEPRVFYSIGSRPVAAPKIPERALSLDEEQARIRSLAQQGKLEEAREALGRLEARWKAMAARSAKTAGVAVIEPRGRYAEAQIQTGTSGRAVITGGAEAAAPRERALDSRRYSHRIYERMAEARKAYELKQYEKAEALADEILKLDPVYPDARRLRDQAIEGRHRRDRLSSWLQDRDSGGLPTDEPRIGWHAGNDALIAEIERVLDAGRRLYGQGEYAGALAEFRRAWARLQSLPDYVDLDRYRRQADQAIQDTHRRQKEDAEQIERESYAYWTQVGGGSDGEDSRQKRAWRILNLYKEAREALRGRSYERAEGLAEEILKLDPTSEGGQRIRAEAIESRHQRDRLPFWLPIRENTERLTENERETPGASPAEGDVAMRAYDIRDVTGQIVMHPGPAITLPRFRGGDAAEGREVAPSGQDLALFIRENVAPGRWGPGTSIQFRDGSLVINQTPDVQRSVVEFLNGLREARERAAGAPLLEEEAKLTVSPGGRRPAPPAAEDPLARAVRESRRALAVEILRRDAELLGDVALDFRGSELALQGRSGAVAEGIGGDGFDPAAVGRLDAFLAGNYAWTLRLPADGRILRVRGDRLAAPPEAAEGIQGILAALRDNQGRKIGVRSVNLRIPEAAAASAGIEWKTGAGGTRYALCDAAELLTLRTLGRRLPAAAPGLARERTQEAIPGTRALLANGEAIEIALAADDGNGLLYRGTWLDLPHDRFLLVLAGGLVTAVQGTGTAHWTEEIRWPAPPAPPEGLEVPRVGRGYRFEKTLAGPEDDLGIRCDYRWKGDEG